MFTDTSGRVSDTVHMDWSRIYFIFLNENFSSFTHDLPTYQRIRSSQLHCIDARPPFMPYTYPVKWALDNASPKECSFDDNVHTHVVSFHLDVFSRGQALGPPKHLLTLKFLDEAISRFNYEEVVKSWMEFNIVRPYCN